MSELVEQVLSGVVPPAVVAGLLLGGLWHPWRARDRQSRTGPAWGAPLALGLGFFAAHVALSGWPPLSLDAPLRDSIAQLALVAALAGCLEAWRAMPRALAHGIRGALALAAPYVVLDFMREHHWTGTETVVWTLGSALALLLLVLAFDRGARRGPRPRPGTSFVWLVMGSLAAGSLSISGSASLGQLAGAWVTVVGVSWVLGLACRGFSLAPAGAPFLGLVYGALLRGGHFASDLSTGGLALLGAAPLGPWTAAGARFLPERLRPWVGGAAALLLAASALALEQSRVPEDPYAAYR